jgi:hypothetical protein
MWMPMSFLMGKIRMMNLVVPFHRQEISTEMDKMMFLSVLVIVTTIELVVVLDVLIFSLVVSRVPNVLMPMRTLC